MDPFYTLLFFRWATSQTKMEMGGQFGRLQKGQAWHCARPSSGVVEVKSGSLCPAVRHLDRPIKKKRQINKFSVAKLPGWHNRDGDTSKDRTKDVKTRLVLFRSTRRTETQRAAPDPHTQTMGFSLAESSWDISHIIAAVGLRMRGVLYRP